ncbi:uncharacterized protein TRAVEDRAFT_166690 [Trametes versicolor FP-101664 SS1]|uniref:uncharacterized protein n=1 Tax=Trametes versicolor (strain FP-101664) TaxID=717944 RepID=UPI00046218A2|nr:uncharacterized protein TRAVEDRAFT_166690 [Trametes versicolor FP-101664 SS1]EIW59353.1 hypothetical protein TRAVEDRAFT_166690 [Trametes versicolor FP-101664 SS1]
MSNPRGNRGFPRRGGRGRGGGPPPPAQARAPPAQHRTYEPGKRHMELIPSVSRSSGLDKDGDALRDPKVQEEYRAFIQTKASGPVPGGGSGDADLEKAASHRKETEGNLLILLRKLREGLMSTQRRDAFALEVYETSLHLSVLFKSPAQTTSTLSHLFPAFYVVPAQARPPTSTLHTPEHDAGTQQPVPESPPPTALASTLIFLLHHLVSTYPSQLSFHTQLRQLHPTLQQLLRAPLATAPYEWLTALARCLRRRDYARLGMLTEHATFGRFVDVNATAANGDRRNLAKEAIQVLVESLLEKAREPAWNVLRTAYREVHLRTTPTGAAVGETTAAWLARSLVLRSTSAGGENLHGDNITHDVVTTWLEERSTKGEARRKEGEGMESRWILVKA